MSNQRQREWTVEEEIAIDIIRSVHKEERISIGDLLDLKLIAAKFYLQVTQLAVRGERSAWLESWCKGLGVPGVCERDLTKLPREVMEAILEEPTGEMTGKTCTIYIMG
jgi:hypothetical protein